MIKIRSGFKLPAHLIASSPFETTATTLCPNFYKIAFKSETVADSPSTIKISMGSTSKSNIIINIFEVYLFIILVMDKNIIYAQRKSDYIFKKKSKKILLINSESINLGKDSNFNNSMYTK